jgi:hypothetical protein
MGTNTNDEKSRQLGMPHGTANGRLRKMIIFHLLKELKQNFCFQCGAEIERVDELSIEHKKPWLHESVDLFWDLNNIAFSHLHCNISAGRRVTVEPRHGTAGEYKNRGCRCELCRGAMNERTKLRMRKLRSVRKQSCL